MQEKKRFDRGTKYSTVEDTAPPVATPVQRIRRLRRAAGEYGTKTYVARRLRSTKPKKVKREKVRYGQAPRNSLPAGPEETASGSDVGAGAALRRLRRARWRRLAAAGRAMAFGDARPALMWGNPLDAEACAGRQDSL